MIKRTGKTSMGFIGNKLTVTEKLALNGKTVKIEIEEENMNRIKLRLPWGEVIILEPIAEGGTFGYPLIGLDFSYE